FAGDPFCSGSNLLFLQCPLPERLRYELPFVFINDISRLVSLDLLNVDPITFEYLDHFPNPTNVFRGVGLEPTNPAAELVAPKGTWLFQVLAEPPSKCVQL